MKFHVLTLFPDMVARGLSESITGRAAADGKIEIDAVNIRDYTENKHKKVDDYPYGGGAGMLLQAQPVFDAYEAVRRGKEGAKCGKKGAGKPRVVYMTPQGRTFCQEMAEELAKEEELVILCGHYEGIDERVLEEIVTDPVSVGDFVLTGGELAAMVLIDAVSRLVPGVLHNGMSAEKESFQGSLLEYPQYTRPEVWRGKRVPEVLLSGNHKKVDEWRHEQSVLRTRKMRPDLYAGYERLQEALRLLYSDKLLHMDMIEAVRRENARLLFAGEEGVLLQERRSGVYMLTASSESSARMLLTRCNMREEAEKGGGLQLVMHQEYLRRELTQKLRLHAGMPCRQAVYTRGAALPVSRDFELRELDERFSGIVSDVYHAVDGPEYIRSRVNRGFVYGAFKAGRLAGFIGLHEEGSMGMLEVLEPFRRQGAAAALEADCINRQLALGYTPYCQIYEDNAPSAALQEKLGLRLSGQTLVWYTG